MPASRSPRGLLERLTLSGAPMPRTTSHSVWASATAPVVEAVGAAAAPSVSALASAGPFGGVIPGQSPSALTRSSEVTGLLGVSGPVSIATFLINNPPEPQNPSPHFPNTHDAPH